MGEGEGRCEGDQMQIALHVSTASEKYTRRLPEKQPKRLLEITNHVSLHQALVVLTDSHEKQDTGHMIKTVDPLSSL